MLGFAEDAEGAPRIAVASTALRSVLTSSPVNGAA
jgi:hypothetical protein